MVAVAPAPTVTVTEEKEEPSVGPLGEIAKEMLEEAEIKKALVEAPDAGFVETLPPSTTKKVAVKKVVKKKTVKKTTKK